MASVDITDNTGEARDELGRAVIRALTKCGMIAEGYAKFLCPVDTGRLRGSIVYQVDAEDDAVYIGTNVEYAPYVELGTRKQKAQPFLRPAAEDHASEYGEIIESELKGQS